MISDPALYEAYQEAKAAYDQIHDDESRRRYNLEHGLPAPPARRISRDGILANFAGMIPEEWPILLPTLALVLVGTLGTYLITGRHLWIALAVSTPAEFLAYLIIGTLVLLLFGLLFGD